ncbi:hypothetical protein E4U17_000810 [Claviceps sp. LM77 group G4]|nr:hypothetical protein E4U17_000810 [Claviceps sp. LM77 group G4]KAG6079669.1 hypothetical protein E4U33_000111 [Claviceps sp. LM78 group G4]KAG6084257.1 hypothetical protein E4U16_002294 [Claviceps sp. LM84 group G4]
MSCTELPKTKTNIILYLAAGSPQGNSIICELKSQFVEHEVRYIDLTKNEHLEPWFLEISPIGIIPAFTETVRGEDVAVFGTAAILWYLHNEYRRRAPLPHHWSLRAPLTMRQHWEAVDWMCWALHRPGLKQALMYNLSRYGPDSMPSESAASAVEDFLKPGMLNLYWCLNEYLADNEECCMVGNDPTIADFAAFEWISCHALIGHSLKDNSAVKSWYDDIQSENLDLFALDCTRMTSPAILVLF